MRRNQITLAMIAIVADLRAPGQSLGESFSSTEILYTALGKVSPWRRLDAPLPPWRGRGRGFDRPARGACGRFVQGWVLRWSRGLRRF